ncbi:FACT complex subunit [Orobanche hederae]
MYSSVQFKNIQIVDRGLASFRNGELRILLPTLVWRNNESDRMIDMKICEIEEVTWMKVQESIQFDFHMKDGHKHKFTGFIGQDQIFLVNLLNSQGIQTQEEQCVVSGQISASLLEIKGNSLVLKVNPTNKLFEIPLADVTDIETMGEEDVEVSFHIDNTFGATEVDSMDKLMFSIPHTFSQFGGVEDSNPAIEFKKRIMSLDCVRLGSEDPVATFGRLIFLSPRGDYDMDFNLQFFGLKRAAIAVTLLYRSIVSIHVLPKLPKPYPSPQVYVVICVDPPLQIGPEWHAYLVILLNTVREVEEPVEIQMSDDLYASKFKHKLKKSYKGCVHEIVVSVLEGLSGKKHSEAGEYGYGIRSILEAESKKGVLYPLEDAFYFLPDPAIRIFYKDIDYVKIKGSDLDIVLNSNASHSFNTIVQDELNRMNIEIRGYEDPYFPISFKKSNGFKNFKKTKKKEMEKEFPQHSPKAIARKMKKLWIEAPDEMKDFYEIISRR